MKPHYAVSGCHVMCAVDGSQPVAHQWTTQPTLVALSQSSVLPRGVDNRFGLSEWFPMHNNQENIVRTGKLMFFPTTSCLLQALK